MTLDLNTSPLTEAERKGAKNAAKATDWKPLLPVPDGTAMGIPSHRLGTPSQIWDYPDAAGRLLFRTCRFDYLNDGKPDKDVMPLCYCEAPDGRRDWRWKAPPEPRPLLGLDRLATRPAADVMFCEGEKKCKAAETLFPDFVAVSTQGGAKAADKTDYSSVKGRRVVVWPDNDAVGLAYANEVAQLALKAGATEVSIIQVPASFPQKWDLADPLPDGWDAAALRRLLARAMILARTDDDPVPGFHMESDGLHYTEHKHEDEDAAAKPPIHVSGPFKVAALSRDDNGRNWGVLLQWLDLDGRLHEWPMPYSMLAGDTAELRARLLDAGLFVSPGYKARELLTSYLGRIQRHVRVRCVDRTGWHGGTYVTPDGATFGPMSQERVILRSPSSPESLERHGTLDGWRTEVAAKAVGNSRLILATCVAFVGPLLRFGSEASFGFHLEGRSSIGKTIGLRMAGSAWGKPLDSWRTTDNGLESLASAANDGLLLLDELSQVNPAAAEAITYMIGNERGKTRMTRAAELRRSLKWRVAFLSSGEISLAQKLAEIDRTARAGQEVQFIAVPADADVGHGVFEQLHGFADGAALARHLEEATERHRGLAIPCFLARLVEQPHDLCEVFKKARKEWLDDYLPKGADGQVHRVAGRFALAAAAGELAATMDVLPWPEDEAKRATGKCFQDWLRERGGTGPAEMAAGIAAVRAFIATHGASRFEVMNNQDSDENAQRIINRAGFRRLNSSREWEFLIFRDVWNNEVCRGRNARSIAAELMRMKMLIGDGQGKTSRPENLPRLGKRRMYVVTSAIFGDGDEHA